MKTLMAIITVIAVMVIGLGNELVWGASPLTEAGSTQTSPDLALAATVCIVIYAPVEAGADQYVTAQGLGTRVHQGQAHYILTHDHWGDVLDNAAFVQVRRADGELLAEIDGDDWRSAINYRDGGTMIVNAPDGLPGLIDVGDSDLVAAGDSVLVMHHSVDAATGHITVEAYTAVVVSVDVFHGRTSYNLRLPDGQVIVHGDSGGGIFCQGQLVGNMWATVVDTNWAVWTWDSLTDSRSITSESIGAANPF